MLTKFKTLFSNTSLYKMPSMAFAKEKPQKGGGGGGQKGGAPAAETPHKPLFKRKVEAGKIKHFEFPHTDPKGVKYIRGADVIEELLVEYESDPVRREALRKRVEEMKQVHIRNQLKHYQDIYRKYVYAGTQEENSEEFQKIWDTFSNKEKYLAHDETSPLYTPKASLPEFKEYEEIKMPLDEQVKKIYEAREAAKATNILVDQDGYRIDAGLLVSRHPVYLNFTTKELETLRMFHRIQKKYGGYIPHVDEMMDFGEDIPFNEFKDAEVPITHIKPTEKDGTVSWSEHEYYWKKIDPYVFDNKLISHASSNRIYLFVKDIDTGEWTLPAFPMKQGVTFYDMKNLLVERLSLEKWKVAHGDPFPDIIEEREFKPAEREDPKNEIAIGVRTYYFPAFHLYGALSLNKSMYSDHIWVTKHELKKIFNREKYEKYIGILDVV